MTLPKSPTTQSFLAFLALVVLASSSGEVRAWEPTDRDLEAAAGAGDLAGCLGRVSGWLEQRVPTDAVDITETVLKALLDEPLFRHAINQRRFLVKHGAEALSAFARDGRDQAAFLSWALRDREALELYVEGVVPIGIAAREEDCYALSTAPLEIWTRIFHADPDSKEGLYLKLAIATSIAPPGTGSPGAGQARPPVDPLSRYRHFKSAHQKGELFPSFDALSVWEYQKVVQSGASNEDLAWARKMINTWRPDLRVHELVVNSTSEVWRRSSPYPYTDYKSVLSGGGKCGPRSSWAVMVCQAFGIPAIGVAQPGHACVAYKAADPSLEPQPGSAWKVGYGRGWHVSRLEGLSGPDFLAGVEERSRAEGFSRVERLRWLAAALESDDRAAAVLAAAREIRRSAPAVRTDLTASARAAEAERELVPDAEAESAPADSREVPQKVLEGRTRIEAAAFSAMSGVRVYDAYAGGKQVNFQKNLVTSWVEYSLEAPAAGTYALTLKIAAPNLAQVLDVSVGGDPQITIRVPDTTGLWGTTPAVSVELGRGRQTLRISAPYQRGIAVRWLELEAAEEAGEGRRP